MGTKTHTGATAVANKPQTSSAKPTTAQATKPDAPKPANAGQPVAVAVAVAVAGEISAADRAAVAKLLQPYPLPSQVRTTLAYLIVRGGTTLNRTACTHVCKGPNPLWRSSLPNPGRTPGATWGVQIGKYVDSTKTRAAFVTKQMGKHGMLELSITDAGRAFVNAGNGSPVASAATN